MNRLPNDPPVILLVGDQGQVGWELRRTLAPLGRVTSVDYPEVNLAEGDSVRGWVKRVQPQIIVNAAAYTAVDKAESETDLAMKINGQAPGILAEEAKKLGALLVHYSTDYVYDGCKSSPYVEEDAPNPLSAYGRSKLAGDLAVRQVDGAHLIFRLCWVYGTRGHNFMLTMQRLARERETLRVVRDQTGCPTWSRLIAESTAQAVGRVLGHPRGQRAEGRDQVSGFSISAFQRFSVSAFQRFSISDLSPLWGVYHLAASGSTSWHGFAQVIVDLMPLEERKCRKVEAIRTEEYPLPAQRPACSVLGCDKLRRVFGLGLPDWEEQLKLASGVAA